MTQTLETKTLSISAVDYFAAKLAYEMTPYTLKGLLEKKASDLCVLDVRSPESFAEGRLPTALHIPLAELAGRLASLPKDKTIVAYCGNQVCSLAPKAALLLAENGFRVVQLSGGFEAWQLKGFLIVK